jgi:hypothetical protein
MIFNYTINFNTNFTTILEQMTSFDTFIEKMASQPDVIAAVAKSNREWEEAAAAELEITVDELLSQLNSRVTNGKLPHQRTHGH